MTLRRWLVAGILVGIACADSFAQTPSRSHPPPKPRPKRSAADVRPAAAEAPALVAANQPCTLSLDGRVVAHLDGRGVETVRIPFGAHLLHAVSKTTHASWSDTLDIQSGRQVVVDIRFPADDTGAARTPHPAVRLAPGTFFMGCSQGDTSCSADEKPRHPVELTRAFDVMISEVTVSQFQEFAESVGARLPDQPRWNTGGRPVVNVTWEEARQYCDWAGGRLPTEAEWERVARAGGETRFAWGDRYSAASGNFGGSTCCEGAKAGKDRWLQSAPVNAFPPNPIGIYDVAGNVWEWTLDWYGDAYRSGKAVDPTGPDTGTAKAVRGGSWAYPAAAQRVSEREGLAPHLRYNDVGFRCVFEAFP